MGFRYTVRALALKYHLKGWVKNLADGSVELELEGEEETIRDFLRDLKGEFRGYLRNIEEEELPYSGDYKDFEIRFY